MNGHRGSVVVVTAAQRESNALGERLRIVVDEDRCDTGLFTPLEQDFQCFGILLSSNHCTHTRTNNRGFFSSDTRDRVAEIVLMVQCDLCDGDYVCVGGGGGVEAAAESGFENGELDVRLTESEQG